MREAVESRQRASARDVDNAAPFCGPPTPELEFKLLRQSRSHVVSVEELKHML